MECRMLLRVCFFPHKGNKKDAKAENENESGVRDKLDVIIFYCRNLPTLK